MNYAEKKLIIKNAWAKYLVGGHHDKLLNDEYNAALQMLTVKQNERFEKEEIEEEWRNKVEKESVNQDGAKCENCNYTHAQVSHTCPYKEDICGDYETFCNCCNDCKIACGEDI